MYEKPSGIQTPTDIKNLLHKTKENLSPTYQKQLLFLSVASLQNYGETPENTPIHVIGVYQPDPAMLLQNQASILEFTKDNITLTLHTPSSFLTNLMNNDVTVAEAIISNYTMIQKEKDDAIQHLKQTCEQYFNQQSASYMQTYYAHAIEAYMNYKIATKNIQKFPNAAPHLYQCLHDIYVLHRLENRVPLSTLFSNHILHENLRKIIYQEIPLIEMQELATYAKQELQKFQPTSIPIDEVHIKYQTEQTIASTFLSFYQRKED